MDDVATRPARPTLNRVTTTTRPARTRGWLWGEFWRLSVAATFASITVLALSATELPDFKYGSPWWVVEAAGALVALSALPFRRRWPVPVAALTISLAAVSVAAAAPAAICFISLCTHRRTKQIVWASIGWLVSATFYELVVHPKLNATQGDRISSIVITVLSTAFCVAVGLAIGSRRELVSNLQQQVETAASQERSRVQQARLGERSRIAREMHDVLAHRISLVALHSGALAYRTDLSPEQVRDTSAVIRDNAELALAELREVLGVLRQDDAGAIEPPQPNLTELDLLIMQAREADGPVDLVTDGDLDDVPETLSRNAFRIVQEVLTNRRKHAPGQRLQLDLTRHDTELTIRAANSLPIGHDLGLPESGLGLIGLAERVSLAGGTLHHGVDRSHRFVLTAVLPLHRVDERLDP